MFQQVCAVFTSTHLKMKRYDFKTLFDRLVYSTNFYIIFHVPEFWHVFLATYKHFENMNTWHCLYSYFSELKRIQNYMRQTHWNVGVYTIQ